MVTEPVQTVRIPRDRDSWREARQALEAGRKRSWLNPKGRLALQFQILKYSLLATGLYRRGFRNFLDLRVRRVTHTLPGWPKALDGLSILQISDLHIDLEPALLPVLCKVLDPLETDLVVITGDFQEYDCGDPAAFATAMATLAKHLPDSPLGIYGILGNHDSSTRIEAIEAVGIQLLINESVVLGEEPARFLLSGTDDPYYYKLDDLARCRGACPSSLPRILLSHSPQNATEAMRHGYTLMLSGHTHGGQICFPGGWAPARMPSVPRRFFSGNWQLGPLRGYTSCGAGSCHLPIRFNCPPEVVIHQLHPAA